MSGSLYKKNLLFAILIILFSILLYSEEEFFELRKETSEEAYQKILKKIVSITGKPDSLVQILDYLEESESELKKRYKSKRFRYKIEFLQDFFRGRYYSINFKSEKAERHLQKAGEIAFKHHDNKLLLNAEFELGNYYFYKGYYHISKMKYENALNLVRYLGDEEREYKLLHNLARISKYLGEYEEGIGWIREAERFRQDQGRDEELGMLYNNLGSAYNDLEDQENAIKSYLKSEEQLNKIGTPIQRALLYNNLGNYYMQKGVFDKALEYFEKSLDLKEHGSASYFTTKINKGILYYNQGKTDKTMEVMETVEPVCIKKGFDLQLIDIYEFLADYYEDEENFMKAIDYLGKYHKIESRIKKEDALIYKADLNNIYLIEESHRQKEVEETEGIINRTRIQINRIIMISVIIIILVLLNGLIYIIRRTKLRKQQISELLEKNRVLEDKKRRTTDMLNMLQKMRDQLENQIAREMKRIRHRDSMIMIQSRNSVVGEMIGNIAHQWRQPLNAIGLLIQDFSEAYIFDELNDQYVNKKLKLINSLIDYMHQTINDFKNFFDPNKDERVFSAGDVLQRSIDFVSCTFESHNIDYSIDKDDDFKVYGMENELFQALINILNNAKDAFQDKEIVGQKVELELKVDDGAGMILIRDNAGGIKPEVINKVFDPYFTTKLERKGTGIGLYIVKYIIEINFKGRILVENINGGARFQIRLPIYTG